MPSYHLSHDIYPDTSSLFYPHLAPSSLYLLVVVNSKESIRHNPLSATYPFTTLSLSKESHAPTYQHKKDETKQRVYMGHIQSSTARR
mmetsp:Transcript_31809/g.60771  ORF Transcript_31809/g.60771 Transcript_31809/m.60771 type:complete len:88 (-) Transcript_31809:1295-1558(-)